MRHEKTELSKKNHYYLSKHRYLELKHFCLQYPEWKHALSQLNGWESPKNEIGGIVPGNIPADPTERQAILRAYYSEWVGLVERCAKKVDPVIGPYILKGVTEALSYAQLRARNCPCGRDVYYELCRKFFWLLSKERS